MRTAITLYDACGRKMQHGTLDCSSDDLMKIMTDNRVREGRVDLRLGSAIITVFIDEGNHAGLMGLDIRQQDKQRRVSGTATLREIEEILRLMDVEAQALAWIDDRESRWGHEAWNCEKDADYSYTSGRLDAL
jgi:hypothetical protein